jgi:hypothetical protein
MIVLNGKSQSARNIPRRREACQGDSPARSLARLVCLWPGGLRQMWGCESAGEAIRVGGRLGGALDD